jgi:hypothetical protein
MELFVTTASLTTLALSIFVAIRLFVAALRTRGAPELAMGLYQGLIVTAIGLYTYLGAVSATVEPAHVFDVVVTANLLIALGVVALSVGVMRIYRASETWARWLCSALVVWVLAGWGWSSMGETLPTTVAATIPNAFFVSGRSAVYLWGAYEGIRYASMLRRRAALGLGDPVIAHRILMWGLFSLTMGTLAIVSLAVGYALGSTEGFNAWTPARFITPTLSLIASILLGLGFFPPVAYQRFVARRMETAQQAS